MSSDLQTKISRDIIAINLTVNNTHFIFISVYCSPSEDIVPILQQLESIIEVHQDSFISINGDFTAKSSAWGPTEQDERGKALLELVFRQDLDIGNDIYSAPTFDSERGKSWIDLTLTKDISREDFKNWVVHQDVTASDHNLITYEITYEKSERPKNKCWKIEDLKLIDFRKDPYLTILKLKGIKIDENNIEEILEGLDEIMNIYLC
ncbi:hypothetical protein AVEN_273735-1 [Araneus ventricosus]|uniref:Endonuclease/exonuclease/phosphatase domain-containing protein n=1 Tax=Araneus ventricosus TaxID=182803 RepID=A0A4Y2MGH1_ARAVE|nr:hypothetical protein AVEN_245328-1 [Araneus ventricosus]GBN25583.1 hypothetical protein AVEN_62727-1 [Araneus ventricosus]GBN25622.1 hypothetical protein AVEN_179774-1 [Araneus ventricosus]GBN27869.1 hypothetical protein AVEN_273735-1 [Araneus ventricosus]